MNCYIYPIEWIPEYSQEIQAVYQMFKDQELKIFSLDVFDNYDSMMDIVQDMIENDRVFVIRNDENTIVGSFILEDAIMYKNIITEVNVHYAIRRPFWGPTSRDITRQCIKYLNDNYLIKKLIAAVPQNKYGVIKLLKDVGFIHEGTLKECMLFKDKNNKLKWYDRLIYTLTRKDI